MKNNMFLKKLFMIIVIVFLASAVCCRERLRERFKERTQNEQSQSTESNTSSSCDSAIPDIRQGYGARGRYDFFDMQTLTNPLWKGKEISVFFPKGVSGKAPVIFFSHGYGASNWKRAYEPLIKYMTSCGFIVVYSPYQTFFASVEERYATLWKGFEVAVQSFGSQMDLTRVGFVGHSFGGGATPAMAYKGLVKMGWGSKGAFMFILAPWYSFDITPEEMRQFPSHVFMVVQIYDKDTMNDHRMAIDLFRNISLPADHKYFQIIDSKNIGGCEIIADHRTPATNPSIRQKQYAVFKTFNALFDLAFYGSSNAINAIKGISPTPGGAYQPIVVTSNPEPQVSEKEFHFPWNNSGNLRRSMENW
jgi:hypothetical protein